MKNTVCLFFLSVFLIGFFIQTSAQVPGLEAKNWYFGTGTDGLVFDSLGNVTKVNNKVSGMGFEGMIVANHPTTGELLFYSDGERVIDKNHNIIANGTGLNGHYSGAQDVQCLPVPCSPDKYYLLTNGAHDNGSGNLYYSIVDFSDTSFPNGVVKNKNTMISNINYGQANKLVPKSGTSDYWWIGHEWNSNKYHVIAITSSGFAYSHAFLGVNSTNSYTMAFSNVNQKLAVSGSGGLILFDFNPVNGQFSNETLLSGGGAGLGNFSPDGTKLYFSLLDAGILKFHQYDFNNGVITNMNTCCYAHDVKTAPNGKMYYMHTYYGQKPLGVINKPNLSAVNNACEAMDLDITVTGEVRRFPEFVTIPYAKTDLTKTINSCGASAKITVTHNIQSDSIAYRWYFNNTIVANQISPSILVTQSGDYEVYIYDYHNCTSSPIIYKKKTNLVLAEATIVGTIQNIACLGLFSGRISTTITGGNPPYTYKWSNGATTSTISNLAAGTYTVTVSDTPTSATALPCQIIKTFTITQSPILSCTLYQFDVSAVGKSDGIIGLTVAGGTPPYKVVLTNGASVFSSGGVPPQYIYTNLAKGSYTYTITDANGCTKSETIILNDPLCPISVAFSGDTTICQQQSTELHFTVKGASNFEITYSNGLSNQTITTMQDVTVMPSTTTTYKLVRITSGSCVIPLSGSVTVTVNHAPQLTDAYYTLTGNSKTMLINCVEIMKKQMPVPPPINIYVPTLPANSGIVSNVDNESVLFNVQNIIGKKTVEIPLRVCSQVCPNLCDSSKFFISFDIPENTFDIIVQKVLSVNHSFALPLLDIDGLDRFPNNEMVIFNRWGTSVFGPVVYQNGKIKQAWDGTKNGERLPTGAYYYYIKYSDNNLLKTKRGIIYLIDNE